MRLQTPFVLQSLLLTSLSAQASSLPRTIYQFPMPTWLENIAATRTGGLLIGMVGKPELHLIDPFAASNSSIDALLQTFPGFDSVFGISELQPDVWAVATGNYSLAGPTLGSSALWRVDLSNVREPKARKIADLPRTKLVNGIAALSERVVLMADSFAGNVLRLDVESGAYDVVLQNAALAANASSNPAIGVNGLKVLHATAPPTLVFSNSQFGIVGSVPVHPVTGRAVGQFRTLAKGLGVVDDLAVLDDGTVVVARVWDNVVERIAGDGTVVHIAGNEALGATAAVLGRTWRDRSVVYVCTSGGLIDGGAGGFVEGGKVVALSLE